MKKALNYSNLRTNENFTKSDLFHFIKCQDASFIPKLSDKVNLEDYATKLYDLAVVNICNDDDKIVGVCAFYCNEDSHENAFLSFLSVVSSHRNNGIAKKMLQDMILYCKQSGIKGLQTSTWLGNKAVGLYMSLGFKATYKLKEKRVILDLSL